MITIQALRGGAAAAGYYLQREAGCEHERGTSGVGYYVDGGEELGRWIGQGAVALGLVGALSRDAGGPVLSDLLDGRLGRETLARPVWRMIDDAQGEPTRTDVRRAGYDVTFSAPKSVSVLFALGSEQVAAEARAAHQAAVADALALLEQLSARAARGHQGEGQRAPRIATAGLIGARFDHTASRALDPQLHTHVVLVNLVHGRDGRWSALDSRTLYLQATTASHLYQHRLRAELTARLGVEWEPVERGVADIRGVPLTVRREFAQRRRQIEAALRERTASAGPEGEQRQRRRRLREAAQRACLATRPAKRHAPTSTLHETWAARARAAGFSTGDLHRLLAAPRRPPAEVDIDALVTRVLGEHGVTREAATFDQGTVVREICNQLPPGAQISTGQVLRLAAQLVRTDDVIPVVSGDGPAFTTLDMLSIEQRALELASRRAAVPLAVVPPAQAAAAIVRSELRPDQQRVAVELLTAGRPVDVITGPAGSGKTAGLRAATELWQQRGLRVAGTAVAALTAQGLQDATGATSVSLARLLHDPERHLPSNGVLLVDEAGMIGSRALQQLLQLSCDRDCKLVLVGDPAQLSELEAGGLFAALSRTADALRLDGHHRQRERWEQHALADLRAGRTERALDAYDRHDRLRTATTAEALQQRLVTDYLKARAEQPDPWQVIVLARRRVDIEQLNSAIRSRLREVGVLGDQALTVTIPDGQDREYRVGDQVLITRNDHSRQLLNGTTATVTALDAGGLRLRTRDGRDQHVPTAWLGDGRLEHAYALTLHKSQGRTVHTALLLADDHLGKEAGYVGLSRGTHANYLYLDSAGDLGGEQPCRPGPAWQRPTPPQPERLLARTSQQRLACDQLPGRVRG